MKVAFSESTPIIHKSVNNDSSSRFHFYCPNEGHILNRNRWTKCGDINVMEKPLGAERNDAAVIRIDTDPS